MRNDVDSPDYNDTNLGDPRETPEEKQITRLEKKIAKFVSWIDTHHKEDWKLGLWEHLGK